MSIIERSIRQPVAVTVAVLLVVIFGLLGLFSVPVQLTPNVDQPVIRVTTNWFGASPQEIETEIIEEQEEILKSVRGLREMTSQSVQGSGTIQLLFYVGVDKEVALNEVRDKLRQVPVYPRDVDEPVVESVTAASDDAMAWIVVRPVDGDSQKIQDALASGRADPQFIGDVRHLQDFMDDEVRPYIERVEGVARVQVFGGQEREAQVRVDMQKLAARSIPLSQLVAALQEENVNVTAGTLDEGKREHSIRAVGQYETPQQLLNTVIAYSANGSPVYVRDVASVELGFKKPVGFVRELGEGVLAIRVQRETGTNALTVMEGMKEAIQLVNRDILAPRNWGLELYQVYDETLYIEQSVSQAAEDIVWGGVLAAIVLFLTLRSFGATLVVAISIPISIVGTFMGMALTGRNLNVISMAGLSFAIGMGVDNTIVVLENIFRHREMGKDRARAALEGTREVWGAIVAATLANIAVFLPVVLIEEEAGQLFRDISVAISISLVFYMIVSPTVIPMLATLMLRRIPAGLREQAEAEAQATRAGRWTRPVAMIGVWMAEMFRKAVFWLTGGWLRRIVVVVGMVSVAVLASWFLMPPRNYLPPGNQNFVFGLMFPPPGYNLEEFARIADQVEAKLRPWWEAKPGSAELAQLQQQWTRMVNEQIIPGMEAQIAGMKAAMPPEQFEKAAAPLQQRIMWYRYTPAPAGIDVFFFVAYNGRLFMGGSSRDPANVTSLSLLMTHAMEGIPGTPGFAMQVPIFRLGRGIGTSLEVDLSGVDYANVKRAAAAVQGAMMQQFATFVQPEPANFNLGRSEMQIEVEREWAAAAGVLPSQVRAVAQAAVDGLIVGDYRHRGRTIDLTVISEQGRSGRLEDLLDIPIVTREGKAVPISAVTRIVPTSAEQEISRLERLPAVGLSVQLGPGTTVEEAQNVLVGQVVEPLRQAGLIPMDVNVKFSGSADKLQEFIRAFIPGFLLAAVITYLLLAALFESFLQPFVIIMSVPFALVGGFLGLFLMFVASGFQTQMDVLAMLGFIILVGTIVNNPILIVHQALNYMREGMERRDAIALSTQTRVRPIFMSVTTSVAGMAPLVIFGGAGSELYRGLGAVVVGGLLLSTVFTLFLTPTLMSIMLDLQALLKRLLGLDGARPAKGQRRVRESERV